MRIVIARCSATYTGRGGTKRNPAVRAIMLKDDGAVSVHNDVGNKPLNYMGKDASLTEKITEDGIVWIFENRKDNLTLTLHTVISDSEHILDVDDEGLIRDGTEKQLQDWIEQNPHVIGEGYKILEREFNTGDGTVDFLALDDSGAYVALEIKRNALLGSVGQTMRYVAAMKENEKYADVNVRGMIMALDVRPKTLALAEKRGIECVVISDEWYKRHSAGEYSVQES